MLIIFLIDANQIAGGALLSTQEVCKECQNNKQNHLKKKKKKKKALFVYLWPQLFVYTLNLFIINQHPIHVAHALTELGFIQAIASMSLKLVLLVSWLDIIILIPNLFFFYDIWVEDHYLLLQVNGGVSKEEVFAQIDSALEKLVKQKKATAGPVAI